MVALFGYLCQLPFFAKQIHVQPDPGFLGSGPVVSFDK